MWGQRYFDQVARLKQYGINTNLISFLLFFLLFLDVKFSRLKNYFIHPFLFIFRIFFFFSNRLLHPHEISDLVSLHNILFIFFSPNILYRMLFREIRSSILLYLYILNRIFDSFHFLCCFLFHLFHTTAIRETSSISIFSFLSF